MTQMAAPLPLLCGAAFAPPWRSRWKSVGRAPERPARHVRGKRRCELNSRQKLVHEDSLRTCLDSKALRASGGSSNSTNATQDFVRSSRTRAPLNPGKLEKRDSISLSGVFWGSPRMKSVLVAIVAVAFRQDRDAKCLLKRQPIDPVDSPRLEVNVASDGAGRGYLGTMVLGTRAKKRVGTRVLGQNFVIS